MYIAKIIKHSTNSKEYWIHWERVGTSGIKLFDFAKKAARKEHGQKGRRGNKLSPFTEIHGHQENFKAIEPDYYFYHGFATVFNEYGRPVWIIEISIYEIEEIS